MQIYDCANEEALVNKANLVFDEYVSMRSSPLICAATGNSPLALYRSWLNSRKWVFSNFRLIKLDEWVGVPPDHPSSCEYYLHQHLIAPLGIHLQNYFGLRGDAEHLQEECKRAEQVLKNQGPIDVSILGVGKNGHLGFNEPAAFLRPDCHIAQLDALTQSHSMIKQKVDKTPQLGLTLGMRALMESKLVILLFVGQGKEEVKKQFMTKKISSFLPVSMLWMHPNCHCFMLD